MHVPPSTRGPLFQFFGSDVPIGGVIGAMKELERKLGIDLTSPTVQNKL